MFTRMTFYGLSVVTDPVLTPNSTQAVMCPHYPCMETAKIYLVKRFDDQSKTLVGQAHYTGFIFILKYMFQRYCCIGAILDVCGTVVL